MYFATTLLVSAATLAPQALAGNAIVQNACTDPVYLWPVGGSVGERQTIDPGANYTETTHYDYSRVESPSRLPAPRTACTTEARRPISRTR